MTLKIIRSFWLQNYQITNQWTSIGFHGFMRVPGCTLPRPAFGNRSRGGSDAKRRRMRCWLGYVGINGCITWFSLNVFEVFYLLNFAHTTHASTSTRKVGRQLTTLQTWCANLQSLTHSKVKCWVGWAWREDLISSVLVGATFSRMFYSLGGQRMHQSCPQHCQHLLALRLMLLSWTGRNISLVEDRASSSRMPWSNLWCLALVCWACLNSKGMNQELPMSCPVYIVNCI